MQMLFSNCGRPRKCNSIQQEEKTVLVFFHNKELGSLDTLEVEEKSNLLINGKGWSNLFDQGLTKAGQSLTS